MNQDEKWMQLAIQEAIKAEKKGEVPVGAVIVHNSKIIAKSHNSPISNNDPTAHAEVLALREASSRLQNYRIPETTLYVTLEPCTMCFGAMTHARINRLVFGSNDTKGDACCSRLNLTSETIFYNHKIKVDGGILEDDCNKILNSFFKAKRQRTL